MLRGPLSEVCKFPDVSAQQLHWKTKVEGQCLKTKILIAVWQARELLEIEKQSFS